MGDQDYGGGFVSTAIDRIVVRITDVLEQI
jgi:hypothetical protein